MKKFPIFGLACWEKFLKFQKRRGVKKLHNISVLGLWWTQIAFQHKFKHVYLLPDEWWMQTEHDFFFYFCSTVCRWWNFMENYPS
jgi:hypothetical protein